MTNNIIITIDYETWHPSCEKEVDTMKKMGLKIDWEKNIIVPTYKLLEIAEKVGAKLTIMAEMGEYFWLKDNKPEIAEKIAKQLQETIARGHDVQLHLHPHWMPETGVRYDEKDDIWYWNIAYASAEEYPFELKELIKRCKNELEKIISPIKPEYTVKCFRAGGYRVQPFERLHDALIENKIYADTSVYAYGKDKERGIDFRRCEDGIHPYYAMRSNPAICDEKNKLCLEIPIYSFVNGARWMMDGNESEKFAYRFFMNCNEKLRNENVYVLVGHSKEEHNYMEFERQLRILNNMPCNSWKTLNEIIENKEFFLQSTERNIELLPELEFFLKNKREICEGFYATKKYSQLEEAFYLYNYVKKLGCKSAVLFLKSTLINSETYLLVEVECKDNKVLVDIQEERVYYIKEGKRENYEELRLSLKNYKYKFVINDNLIQIGKNSGIKDALIRKLIYLKNIIKLIFSIEIIRM